MECSADWSVPSWEAFYVKLLVVVGEQVLGDVLKVFYLVTPAVSPTFGGDFPFACFLVVGGAGAGVGDCCGVCSAFGWNYVGGHAYLSV